MNMKHTGNIISGLVLLLLAGCSTSPKISYLDDNFPGLEPRIYAPNVLSLPDRNEHGLAIRNKGSEHIFGVDGREDWTYDGLACLKRDDDHGLVFNMFRFTDDIACTNDGVVAGEPSFSLNNQTLFFVADYPTDIWKVEIDENGKWGKPTKLSSTVNSEESEWFPHVAHDHCLYFARNLDGHVVIHKAEPVNGVYQGASKLEAAFNYDCGDQVFSKEMDYVIFTSPRDGGFGTIDLYIAFKKDDGTWTDGINMGPAINTEGFEIAPYISPDNKYLFFTRRHELTGTSSSDIYWVSLKVVSELRNGMNIKLSESNDI